MSDFSNELWIEHQQRLSVIAAEQQLADERLRPFMLHKPRYMGLDGNQHWFLYGLNIQEGCAGFGASLEEASRDFDKHWAMPLKTKASPSAGEREG